jgi:hypothetical protein
MFQRSYHCLVLILGLSIAVTCLAQQSREKSRQKTFGSSMKKLKWDPEKNQTTSTNEVNQRSESDDDVVRINTSLVASDLLVLDRQGRSIRGLVATDFVITEDNTPQQVGLFYSAATQACPGQLH